MSRTGHRVRPGWFFGSLVAVTSALVGCTAGHSSAPPPSLSAPPTTPSTPQSATPTIAPPLVRTTPASATPTTLYSATSTTPSSTNEPTTPGTAPTMTAQARKYLDAALNLMQLHAANRTRLNWAAIRQQVLHDATAAQTPIDTYPAIASAIGKLDVNGHSKLAPQPAGPKIVPVPPGPSQLPSGRLLPGRIGYIALPGISLNFTAQYETAGAAVMRRLLTERPGGWILDLRSDDGGDVWPMLGGIQPLLGSGPIGSFISPPTPPSIVRITPTEITQGGQVSIRMSAAAPQDASADPVVVLTGPATGSAGEFAAIAFRGRRCTTSMGAATYGVPTGNTDYQLSDGADLILTTAFEADRTGHLYPDAPIQPDTQIGAANYFATWRPTNSSIQAASHWLNLHRGCT